MIKRPFSTAGYLLTWGTTTYGWGRPINNNYWTPDYVDNFPEITAVSTGQYHLGFVTQDHSVYTVGLKDNGRLGHSDPSPSELPRRVPFESPEVEISQLRLGNTHSVALSTQGQVSSNSLIFRTESGRIFYNGFYLKYQPTPFPLNVKARKIFASESTVGVISEDNHVYFLNEKIIDDSDFADNKNRVYVVEDDKFKGEVL
ncbi:unnamed protein product [Sphagnum balticum]